MQYSFIREFFLIFTIGMLCFSGHSYGQEWQLEKQQGEVRVYSVKGAFGYKDILAKTTVKSDLLALLRLLDDVEFAPQWVANAIQVKILQAASAEERLVHTFLNAPWPIQNRDMVTYSKTIVEADSIQIDIINQGEETPLHPNYVRMQDVYGTWRVTRIDKNNIEISYQGGGNPAGMIPIWIANKALINATFDTFVKLSEVILLEKYQQ